MTNVMGLTVVPVLSPVPGGNGCTIRRDARRVRCLRLAARELTDQELTDQELTDQELTDQELTDLASSLAMVGAGKFAGAEAPGPMRHI
jgi:hypothetical protein